MNSDLAEIIGLPSCIDFLSHQFSHQWFRGTVLVRWSFHTNSYYLYPFGQFLFSISGITLSEGSAFFFFEGLYF